MNDCLEDVADAAVEVLLIDRIAGVVSQLAPSILRRVEGRRRISATAIGDAPESASPSSSARQKRPTSGRPTGRRV